MYYKLKVRATYDDHRKGDPNDVGDSGVRRIIDYLSDSLSGLRNDFVEENANLVVRADESPIRRLTISIASMPDASDKKRPPGYIEFLVFNPDEESANVE